MNNNLEWLKQIPVSQRDLIVNLLYAGFRQECPNLKTNDKELMQKVFDEIYKLKS